MKRLTLSCAPYHATALHPKKLKESIALACRYAQQLDKKKPFDAIAFKGVSGAFVAPAVCAKLQKYPLFIQQDGDRITRRERNYLGPLGKFKFIILDDMIDHGTTVRAILDSVYGQCPNATCVGIVLYRSSKLQTWSSLPNGVPVLGPKQSRDQLYWGSSSKSLKH